MERPNDLPNPENSVSFEDVAEVEVIDQELKPCPCCGSSNGLYVLQDEKYGEWSVFCDICKTSLHNENHCDTRDDAISAWNRRAERTCRNLNPPSCRDFECSECGESSEFTPGFMPNYCPNCGARVIEEGVCARRPWGRRMTCFASLPER